MYSYFSVSSSALLTATWLSTFLSTEPSRTILWIDSSEPRFKSHAGCKIRKTLKNNGNFHFFVNFWLNQIPHCFVQIKKVKDGIFRFQLKKSHFCQKLTDDSGYENLSPPLDLTRIFKSNHRKK